MFEEWLSLGHWSFLTREERDGGAGHGAGAGLDLGGEVLRVAARGAGGGAGEALDLADDEVVEEVGGPEAGTSAAQPAQR